ncbi:MAG: OmpP1/FadL family transporter [Bacteroidota bacterium]
MNKNLAIIGLMFLLPYFGFAQDFTDALRISNTRIEGSARAGGMGNAFGALGGDFTSVSINPAGLGIYRSGEFALTPYFGRTDADATYLGSQMNDYKYNLRFSNLNYVGTIRTGNQGESGLVGINFGVGVNRLNDFNAKMMVQGARANSSFMDYIAENANWNDWSEFYEELAWKTDMLLLDQQNDEYYHDIMDAGYGQSQRKSYSYNGALDEYTFGVGLNFGHRFYLGATLGITDLYFKEYTVLREWDAQNNIPYFNDFSFGTSLRTSGTGYNFKLGAIFRPVDVVRLGVAVHTPTFYSLRDNFETWMESSITYNDGTENYRQNSPFLDYEYNLETPFKAVVSGAVILAKKGLVSLDYEYLNYGKARLKDDSYGDEFINQNNDIAELFRATGNIRLGGEYRLTDMFSVRAGFEHYPSAYKANAFGVSQPNAENQYNVYSAGFGYKSGGFFMDLAYRYAVNSEYNYLYPAPLTADYPVPSMAKFDRSTNKVMLTLGFRF